MKLREALTQINREELFQILCNLEKELNDADYTLDECRDAYNPVIEELLSHKEVPTDGRIFITMEMTGPEYYDVQIENSKWELISSSNIVSNTNKLDLVYQVAYILWELTYDGWTEKEQTAFYEKLKEMVDTSGFKEILND